jgi:hypothetical protein
MTSLRGVHEMTPCPPWCSGEHVERGHVDHGRLVECDGATVVILSDGIREPAILATCHPLPLSIERAEALAGALAQRSHWSKPRAAECVPAGTNSAVRVDYPGGASFASTLAARGLPSVERRRDYQSSSVGLAGAVCATAAAAASHASRIASAWSSQPSSGSSSIERQFRFSQYAS